MGPAEARESPELLVISETRHGQGACPARPIAFQCPRGALSEKVSGRLFYFREGREPSRYMKSTTRRRDWTRGSRSADREATPAPQEGGTIMDEATEAQLSRDPIADMATDVLTDLYRAVCGRQPKAVRAYNDDDALLLLLRFEPSEIEDGDQDGLEHLLETAFLAMPGMIASAVEARSGHRMVPGNLSVCADRGLAVFAFNAVDESAELPADDDPFTLEALTATEQPAVRIAR
jgi:hypothetical protein